MSNYNFKNGYYMEIAAAGDYYKLMDKNNKTVYQDSANEDCYDFESAKNFFEYYLNNYVF